MTKLQFNSNLEEEIADFNFKTPIEIRFTDIDLLGHVNNAIYLTYFEIARAAYWKHILDWNWKEKAFVVAKSEVNYIKPVFLEDTIEAYIKTSHIGNTSFILDYIIVSTDINGNKTLKTRGKTSQVVIDLKNGKPLKLPVEDREKIIKFENLK